MSKKTTLSFIKNFVANGAAQDLTGTDTFLVQSLRLVCLAYSVGTFGLNGKLLFDPQDGRIYAITSRCTNLFATSC